VTLVGYILRRFLLAVVNVQLVIGVIVLLFAGVENLRRYADADAGLFDVGVITLLQAPEVLYQVFPLVVMLASLVTFLSLARSSELVVLRASGISALRLIAVPAVAGLVLGALAVSVGNPLVAALTREAESAQDQFRSSSRSLLSVGGGGVWLRQGDAEGQTVIRAERATPDGTALNGVMLHRFDEDGTLYARIDAAAARLATGAWVLSDSVRWELDPGGGYARTAIGAQLRLPSDLTSNQILDSFAPPELIPFWQLPRFIVQLENAGFSALRHRLHFQAELAKPVLLTAMVLIGAAFALRPARFGQTGVMILLAVLAGFSLYFLRDFAMSLGASGEIPLRVAAWTPPVAAILLALGLLLHLEDG
jgi:lipopolysaccharide export system permease protein